MSDLISRQQAIDAVMECYDNDELFEVYEDRLERLPSAKTKRGKWILGDMCSVKGYWATCSVCGHTSFGGGKFCRECGAKMEGKKDG